MARGAEADRAPRAPGRGFGGCAAPLPFAVRAGTGGAGGGERRRRRLPQRRGLDRMPLGPAGLPRVVLPLRAARAASAGAGDRRVGLDAASPPVASAGHDVGSGDRPRRLRRRGLRRRPLCGRGEAMKVAVAGGTGFVGRHVVEALRARGHSVIVLARGSRGVPRGAEPVPCDLAREPVPAGALRGCDAVVNLAGIKREDGTQTFEAVHVEATRRLLAACDAEGVRRFVHVSVVCSRPDARLAYHDTKWRAEEAVRASGLDFTILKPAVIYGPGDDMVTHLVRMLRFASLFPVVGRGESILQPVDVRDVAEAVAATLDRPRSIGGTYDVVGPERLPLAEVVRVVADGIGLNVHVVPTPLPLQRLAVRLMNAVTTQPLSTPAQLQMLVDGLYGDTKPARRDLGLVPRPFTAEAVRAIEGPIGSLFGMSLRLSDRRDLAEWLARLR